MRSRKFGIWPMVLACSTLAMVIGCDTPTDRISADKASANEVAITSFKVGQEEGVIDKKKTPKTIKLTVAYGTDLASLAPEIVFSGKKVSPASGAAQDFTDSVINPVAYKVTGRDGSSVEYQVSVQSGNGAGMTINVSLEEDIVASAPSATTIYKDGNPASVTIEASKGFACQWFVDGKPRGTSAAITLDSANLTTGDHFVTLMANKNKIPYSREFTITVIRQFR